MAPSSDAAGEDPPVDHPPDPMDRTSDSFFTWYHHAIALGYTVSAAVSMSSLPLDRLALYVAGSLLGAYVVVAILTVAWRRLVPRLLG